MGNLYEYMGQYTKATDFYHLALNKGEEFGKKFEIAIYLHNLGSIYIKQKQYDKAIDALNRSITLKEEIRISASGVIRRDYLDSQIETFQLLTTSYIRNNEPRKAFDASELSKARYLKEQLKERISEKKCTFNGIENFQKYLDSKTAIVNYTNIDSIFPPVVIVVTKGSIHFSELDINYLNNNNELQEFKEKVFQFHNSLRGIAIVKKNENLIDRIELDDIINYYRKLISEYYPSEQNIDFRNKLSKYLYNFLIANIEDCIKDIDELVIIPDGILGFLPFETLKMNDGKYFVEKYDIKYSQSLAVLEIIKKRKYSTNRKPMIAFGGAVYNKLTYNDVNFITSARELKYLQTIAIDSVKRGTSAKQIYAAISMGNLNNLPGTLEEVKEIKSIVPNSFVITGKAVNEKKLKEMSKKSELKKYAVIHFATHGLVVPNIPELSAIVLSTEVNSNSREDGFLSMLEITDLDINADFVNLSACDTGLGKIYGGEGVVGLTQSFILAGANGISVSLWQVEDISTKQFMIGLYNLHKNGVKYDKAISAMKRKFISQKKYSNPFYWAPFVYYGL